MESDGSYRKSQWTACTYVDDPVFSPPLCSPLRFARETLADSIPVGAVNPGRSEDRVFLRLSSQRSPGELVAIFSDGMTPWGFEGVHGGSWDIIGRGVSER